MTLQEAFQAGVKAPKGAIKQAMVDDREAWGQASTDERCWYVDAVKVSTPELKPDPQPPGGWSDAAALGFGK